MNNNSQLLIYQTPDGNVKIDVQLEDETVWLTQAHLCELFQKSKATVSEHISHIFNEGELVENSIVRNFRTTAKDGKEYSMKYYNLDVIIQLNGRELLTHADNISHQIALDKSSRELERYKEEQRLNQHKDNLEELERDIKKLNINDTGKTE